MRFLLFLLCLLTVSSHSSQASPIDAPQGSLPEMWPNTTYAPEIPTFSQVLGYEVGDQITRYEDMLTFFSALQTAAPTRLKLIEYGKTWEGRRLIYAVIGSPENIARLDEIAAEMRRLADPRVTDRRSANDLIASLPASAWLAFGIHGNEISSTDAAMMTAYHLLAGVNDVVSTKVANHALVFIDPLQNPDGRARFTQHYYSTVGL